MHLLHIQHYTLQVAPEALPVLLDYYTRVLKLQEGDRPAFDFPGHWLYASGHPLIHLSGREPAGEAPFSPTLPTGKFNHVALAATGLQRTREHLAAEGVSWLEAPVPGRALHQLFIRDPVGLQIELSFDAAELNDERH